MVSQIIIEAIVFSEPIMKVAPSGVDYLEMKCGLFNIKGVGPQELTSVDCTLWNNPFLARQVLEMGLQKKDRILISGKLTLKKYLGKLCLRIYIQDLTLLSRAIVSYKNEEHTAEDIDFSIVNGNTIGEFNTDPVKFVNKENVLNKDDNEVSDDEF